MAFFRKLLIYTVPFAIGFLLVTGGLWYVGETMPLEMVASMQAGDTPVLFRPWFGNVDQSFKRISVDYRQPEVIALGSSRVLQFRGQFLSDPSLFYNAAAPAWELNEVIGLLESTQHHPNVIVLGIDLPWFNDAYPGDPIVEPPVSLWERVFVVNRSFFQDVIGGESFDIGLGLGRVEPGGSGGIALGYKAIRDGHGFRNDGSEQYGDFLIAGWLWQPNMRGHHQGLFERGEEMYTYGSDVSSTAMAQMRHILEWARANNVQVIGVLPPYMPSLWPQMVESPNLSYMPVALRELNTLFAEYDTPLFDYSDGAVLGATDEDFFDGWHHSERISAQIFVNMGREVPALGDYIDEDGLQTIVDSATDTFRVFPFMAPRQ